MGRNTWRLNNFFLHLALSRVNGCPGPALSVLGPGTLSLACVGTCVEPQCSVGVWRSLVLCVGICVGRSLCRGLALSVSRPGALCQILALCVGGPALPVALCVGLRHSLCRGPGALFVGPRSGPATLSHSVSGPANVSLFVGPMPAAQIRAFIRHPFSPRAPFGSRPPAIRSVGPGAAGLFASFIGAPTPCAHPVSRPRVPPMRSHLGSTCHLSGPTGPQRSVCHYGPQVRSACHPSSPQARRVPFFQERTPNFNVWGKSMDLI